VRPLIRTFRSVARRRQAAFRELELPVLERWLAITGGTAATIEKAGETHSHPVANWRMACLDFWQSISHRNWAAAEIALQAIDRRRKRPGSDTGPIEPWRALLSAASGSAPAVKVPPPPIARLVLNNLASGIAGAYATGLAGSRESAETWLEWVKQARRKGVESSLELPVSLARVHALLALRAGRPALARRNFATAVAQGAHGRKIEAALARLQLAELQAKMGAGEEAELVAARAELTGNNLDPLPHLYAVHSAWDVGMAKPARSLLTPRELQVLQQLAQGKSYKDSAAALGIAWTTVQTLSHRVYEKLSVSNRVAAIAEAGRLGLL
jgi:DNA-binding CsgD family transcriptional regulator